MPTDTSTATAVTLADYAIANRLTRERALRAAIQNGTAEQIAGRWFVHVGAPATTPKAKRGA